MPERVILPTERLDFSAIAERPKLVLPDGARLVVWVIVNVEEWDPKEPMPRTVLTPACGWGTDARHSELGLARIR
jgi:allantoinase